MRIGAEIDLAAVRLEDVPVRAARIEEAGLDLAWLTPAEGRPQEALVAAAACAATTRRLHIGVRVVPGSHHPLYLAEELHVLDQLLGGRLVAAVAGGGADAVADAGADELADQDRLAETLTVLLSAQATRPFRYEGPNWTIPANLPENTVNPERRLRVTPSPFSLHAELWLYGLNGAACSARFGLPVIAAAEDTAADVAEAWKRITTSLGDAALRMRRAALRPLPEADVSGVDSLVGELREERELWGLDTAIVRIRDASDTAWQRALDLLAKQVRPRLQLDRLPAGLEEFWQEQLTTRTNRPEE